MSAWKLRIGNAVAALDQMPPASVHSCVTSPPYYNLRDYGTGEWDGGDESCDHLMPAPGGHRASGLGKYANGLTAESIEQKITDRAQQYSGECPRCGAVRIDDQIGLEETPEEFVQALVEVFRAVWRVLRDDGTLWLVLGDSYARSAGPRHGNFGRSARGIGIPENRDSRRQREYAKSKDLLGIPWMVAFALRADGWYLRSEVIWSKPNPMPASVTDRPTVAHETIFLLAKSERYYYDHVAIREPDKGTDHERTVQHEPSLEPTGGLMPAHTGLRRTKGRNGAGANKRSVWTVATRPYPEAHFATYPPQLIEPCVLAGTPRQTCGECAAPWERVVEWVETGYDGSEYWERAQLAAGGAVKGGTARSTLGSSNGRETSVPVTVGWCQTCSCDDEGGGVGVVLDPFAGSGTTLEVAVRNGRSATGIDLNPKNERLVQKRMAGVTPSMFDAV